MQQRSLVLCCGSRAWGDRSVILERLSRLPAGTVVVHGGARGADSLCGSIAAELGFAVRVVPADWARFGRSAGPVRNAEMLSLGPALVLAFWDGASSGTADMVARSSAAGVPVEVVQPAAQLSLI